MNEAHESCATDRVAGYRSLSASKEYALKSPACPYCGGKLRFSINGCELDEATGWIADTLDINCDSEPDIDGPHWEDWWYKHSYDYCHMWHDLHERLVRSLKRTHRVIYDNVDVRRARASEAAAQRVGQTPAKP